MYYFYQVNQSTAWGGDVTHTALSDLWAQGVFAFSRFTGQLSEIPRSAQVSVTSVSSCPALCLAMGLAHKKHGPLNWEQFKPGESGFLSLDMCNIFCVLTGCYHNKLLLLNMRSFSINKGSLTFTHYLTVRTVAFIGVSIPGAYDRRCPPSSE